MKKFLSILIAAICLTACAFSFTACGDQEGGETHTAHNWSTTYTEDGDRHYQTCDGCDEKKYSSHDYGTSGVCVCGKHKPDTTVAATGVRLNKSELTLEIGGTATLTATVSPENATDQSVTWESDKTNIATVDNTGKVTAVKDGTAIITAKTANGKTATCTVTVNAALTNAQVLQFLNDNVLMKAAKHFADNNIFSSAFTENNVSNATWYVTKVENNMTGVNLVFNYKETDTRAAAVLYKIDFSKSLTAQNIKNGEIGTLSFTKIYSGFYDCTIQEQHTALTNAICNKLFGENTTATRYIIDNGNNSMDDLGNVSRFTVIEITDTGIKENNIKIVYANTDDGLIANLNDTTKNKTYGDAKNVTITGDKLENDNEPFFGNAE